MKTLLVYYSLEGNTDFVAQMLAKETGADVIRVYQKKEPPEGLGRYLTGGKEALSFKDVGIYTYRDLNPADYDTIILGTPVWAGTYAPALKTYLKENPFENKGVYLFACSISGKTGSALDRLARRIRAGHNDVLGTAGFKNPLQYSNRAQIQVKDFGRKITAGT